MSEEIFEETSEVIFEELSVREQISEAFSEPEGVCVDSPICEEISEELPVPEERSEELSVPEEVSVESSESDDIVDEHFGDLNRLVEKGDHVAVRNFIKENQVKPVTIYRDFQSCIGQEYNRLCPVGLAARCGHVQVMKVLIDAGFLVNEISVYFEVIRPVHLACESGHLEVVKTLVEEYNVDITHIDNCYSRPPMCIVADNGYLEIVQYFIEKAEIPVNSRYGENKDSALHLAAENDQIDVCKYLIAKGADINIGDVFNHTPLMSIAKRAFYNLARVLLDAGADVNMTNDGQETAFLKAAATGNLKMMKLLQSYGADPEMCDRFTTSPLYKAVSDNRRDIVYYLVNELNVRIGLKVTIEPTDYYKGEWQEETACMLALREGSYDIVKLLFNAGYDPSEELAEFEDIDDEIESTHSSENSYLKRKKKSYPVHGDRGKLRELRRMIARPRSLLALSVLTVRSLLGRQLPVYLERLPLPDILKNVIVSCGEE